MPVVARGGLSVSYSPWNYRAKRVGNSIVGKVALAILGKCQTSRQNIYQKPACQSLKFLPAGSNSRASTFYIPNKGHQKAASTLLGVSLQNTAAGTTRNRWNIKFCEISAHVQNKQKYSQK
ncbi:hypothetical protein D0A37_17015 [Microcoleus vaginatus HSN003]|nr:hypothetical protein D0A37_17015 [Microcoleus vaginatus HSN003]